MRYDSWSVRILRIAGVLAIYLLIGMTAMAGSGSYTLTTNLLEKLVCACAMGYLFMKDNQKIVWKKPSVSVPVWLFVVLAGAGICIGMNKLFEITGLMKLLAKDYKLVTEALYGQNLLLEILVLAAAAPLAEELLFRGLLFRRMRTYCSYLPAAIVTSLIFAVFHGNILQGIYGFAVGILFTWVYEELKTIWAPICCHAAANAISLAATEWAVLKKVLAFNPIISSVVGMTVLVVAVVMVRKSIRKLENEERKHEVAYDSGSKL